MNKLGPTEILLESMQPSEVKPKPVPSLSLSRDHPPATTHTHSAPHRIEALQGN